MGGKGNMQSSQYANITTDHNGKVLHQRAGGVPIKQPVSTTVTISKEEISSKPIDRLISFQTEESEDDYRSKRKSITKAPTNHSLLSK